VRQCVCVVLCVTPWVGVCARGRAGVRHTCVGLCPPTLRLVPLPYRDKPLQQAHPPPLLSPSLGGTHTRQGWAQSWMHWDAPREEQIKGQVVQCGCQRRACPAHARVEQLSHQAARRLTVGQTSRCVSNARDERMNIRRGRHRGWLWRRRCARLGRHGGRRTGGWGYERSSVQRQL
jgi:hypothetical protein